MERLAELFNTFSQQLTETGTWAFERAAGSIFADGIATVVICSLLTLMWAFLIISAWVGAMKLRGEEDRILARVSASGVGGIIMVFTVLGLHGGIVKVIEPEGYLIIHMLERVL